MTIATVPSGRHEAAILPEEPHNQENLSDDSCADEEEKGEDDGHSTVRSETTA